MISIPALVEALKAIGNAQVFRGDPFTAGGFIPIGAKEGAISVEFEETYSDLTAPELTGPAVHQRLVMGSTARVTIPVIAGSDDLYATMSPTGLSGGGHSSPQPVVTTSILIIPNAEVGGGLSYDGTTWTRLAGNNVAAASGAAAAPKHAVILWRAAPQRPSRSFSPENGGKQILSVVYQAMFFDGAAVPEGQKVWTQGDPVAKGITTFRL